jgi:Flp pilus assembly protein TadG
VVLKVGARPGEDGRPARSRSQRGAAAVEFALLVPLLLMLVFGIVDFGFMMNRNTMLANAAREGVRAASLGGTADEVTATVERALPAMAGGVTVTVSCLKPDGAACPSYSTGAVSGGTAVVDVDYDYHWVTPVGEVFSGETQHLSQTSRMRIE